MKRRLKMINLKSFKMSKTVKGGILWMFLTSNLLQNTEKKLWEGPFGDIKKLSEKSPTVSKKCKWGP